MKRVQRRGGFASLPTVTAVALMLTLSLLVAFRQGMLNRDQAARSQLRADYRQREDALLRALVAVFPQKAIDCMKAGYAPSDEYSWRAIMAEAVAVASASEGMSASLRDSLGHPSARSGDVGDATNAQVQGWVTSLNGVEGQVTPGTTAYASVFQRPEFAGKVPPLLDMASDLQALDEVRPVISLTKKYVAQVPGLMADVTKHPVFNLIPYPNVRFGYAAAGAPFVAKRNWWAISLRFGTRPQGAAPVPVITRNYVLSLYEIPSQLPIEGAAMAEIGKHRDGVAWNSAMISITGGIYGDQVSMFGAYGASRVAGRQDIQMSERLTLDGTEVGEDFDAAGVREQLQVSRHSDILPVGLSANSGRLAFLPLNRGQDFLIKPGSPNGWDIYSRGALKCRMNVEAVSMVSLEDQTPTAIRVRYATSAGGTSEVTLRRGSNWPTPYETGGTAVPFQTELTDSNHACLTFHPGLLDAWLTGRGGAGVTVNNSISFGTDPAADPLTVCPVSDTPSEGDMAVIVRKGLNLTSFTAGLSIVAPLRVYLGDDLNAVPMAAPSGSGLPAGSTYYPPLSIFAGELRVGTTSFNRPFEHHGQISTLASSASGSAWQPLDVKSGGDDAVHADTISAELKPLRSPAELPPVHQMNWMVVLEEIISD